MFQRILLAIDAGDPGSVATSFTVALAKKCEAAVHVLHVSPYLVGGAGFTSESPAEAADIVAEALREIHAAGVRATGVTYRTTAFDLPAAICDLADQCRADAIVVGSRRRRGCAFLRRSTHERIARRTSLPILTAPAPLRIDKRDRALDAVPSLLDLPVRS
ncbi:MAG: universal stress protein [Acidimicrobiales bacterium]